MAEAREALDRISMGAKMPEYCGLPMPIPGERLVLEPRHPAAHVYKADADKHDPLGREVLPDDYELINFWHSRNRGADVYIWRENNQYHWGYSPAVHHLKQDLTTMACSVAWSLSAEAKAQSMLAELITHPMMRAYLLTGMFLETSKRSGVTYIFRRLRPTVALRPNKDGSDMRILCALCMHPIGYYAGSWAGGLVPTDDVVAHLLLMRSDEHMFWRRCNQHPPHHPLAGL